MGWKLLWSLLHFTSCPMFCQHLSNYAHRFSLWCKSAAGVALHCICSGGNAVSRKSRAPKTQALILISLYQVNSQKE